MTMTVRTRFVAILFSTILLVLNACGKDSDDSNADVESFNGHDIAVVDGVGLTAKENEIDGTGTVKFVTPLAEESAEGAHIGVDFELTDDKGSVTIVAFADKSLENGIEVVLSPEKSEFKVGSKTTDITAAFADVNWEERTSVRFDFHNDENPTHVIAWVQSLTKDVSEDTEVLNSEEEEDGYAVPGHGVGTVWGLRLKQAKIHKVMVDHPQEEHDHEH